VFGQRRRDEHGETNRSYSLQAVAANVPALFIHLSTKGSVVEEDTKRTDTNF